MRIASLHSIGGKVQCDDCGVKATCRKIRWCRCVGGVWCTKILLPRVRMRGTSSCKFFKRGLNPVDLVAGTLLSETINCQWVSMSKHSIVAVEKDTWFLSWQRKFHKRIFDGAKDPYNYCWEWLAQQDLHVVARSGGLLVTWHRQRANCMLKRSGMRSIIISLG